MKIEIKKKILNKNEEIAGNLREIFDGRGIFVANVMSAPGAGKTTLLEKTVTDLKGLFRMGVVVGDPQTRIDTMRLSKTGVHAEQINTGRGCHLDAQMISRVITYFDLGKLEVLFIENVGNLVCPAEFDLGEDVRIVMNSIPEGHDKPAKYPALFHDADVVLLNKIDLLGVINFDLDKFAKDIMTIKKDLTILPISCTTGKGLDKWYKWLEMMIKRKRGGGG